MIRNFCLRGPRTSAPRNPLCPSFLPHSPRPCPAGKPPSPLDFLPLHALPRPPRPCPPPRTTPAPVTPTALRRFVNSSFRRFVRAPASASPLPPPPRPSAGRAALRRGRAKALPPSRSRRAPWPPAPRRFVLPLPFPRLPLNFSTFQPFNLSTRPKGAPRPSSIRPPSPLSPPPSQLLNFSTFQPSRHRPVARSCPAHLPPRVARRLSLVPATGLRRVFDRSGSLQASAPSGAKKAGPGTGAGTAFGRNVRVFIPP